MSRSYLAAMTSVKRCLSGMFLFWLPAYKKSIMLHLWLRLSNIDPNPPPFSLRKHVSARDRTGDLPRMKCSIVGRDNHYTTETKLITYSDYENYYRASMH